MKQQKASDAWDLSGLKKEFAKRFGNGEAARVFAAHGRSELGGNHTDHNQGKVIAAALDLPALAAVTPRQDLKVRVQSRGWDGEFSLDLQNLEPQEKEKGSTEALIRGLAYFMSQASYSIGGFDAWIDSSVLPGSGLSSSAAMEVLFGAIQSGLYNEGKLKPLELAKFGQKAENLHFGKPCGLMDQMACAHGGILAIDFKDPANPLLQSLDLDLAAQGYGLLICDTGGDHSDLTPDYAAIPAEMKSVAQALGGQVLRDIEEEAFYAALPELKARLSHRALLRASHFFAENRRVDAMLKALKQGDFPAYLEEVRLSGLSSAQYLQNSFSVKHVEEQGVTLALALCERLLGHEGAWRVHGGGLAGTIQAYVPLDKIKAFVESMERVFGSGSARVLTVLNEAAGEL